MTTKNNAEGGGGGGETDCVLYYLCTSHAAIPYLSIEGEKAHPLCPTVKCAASFVKIHMT